MYYIENLGEWLGSKPKFEKKKISYELKSYIMVTFQKHSNIFVTLNRSVSNAYFLRKGFMVDK